MSVLCWSHHRSSTLALEEEAAVLRVTAFDFIHTMDFGTIIPTKFDKCQQQLKRYQQQVVMQSVAAFISRTDFKASSWDP